MNLRTRHRWLSWLLPLLILRAFVPVGFMYMAGQDGIELMLCSGSGPMATLSTPVAPGSELPAAHDHHAHHAMPADADASPPANHHPHDSAPSAHENSLCPFAAAGTAVAMVAAPAPAPWSATAGSLIFLPRISEPSSVSIFIDRIRGPPVA